MSEKASQFRIGVFVLVGLAILASGLFLFGIRKSFKRVYPFETYILGDVEGLSVGSAVKLRGVVVGKVTEIGFSWKLYGDVPPRCIVVRFSIEENVSPLPSGADIRERLDKLVAKEGFRAVIQGQIVTGASVVSLTNLDPNLYPPLAVPWKPRNYYIPAAPSQFGQIVASVDRALANLAALDLAKVVGSADHALISADAMFQKFSQLDVPSINRSVNRVAADAGSAVREYKGLAQDARKTLQAMRLEKLGPDTDRLVNNLDAQLEILIRNLNDVDVGALNETLAGTREAARNLNDALEALKEYPSGFLFGPPPSQVRAVAKEDK
jgi:phospholipid/cholesterol/gamma-HCH transport system substrate-binding protein